MDYDSIWIRFSDRYLGRDVKQIEALPTVIQQVYGINSTRDEYCTNPGLNIFENQIQIVDWECE